MTACRPGPLSFPFDSLPDSSYTSRLRPQGLLPPDPEEGIR